MSKSSDAAKIAVVALFQALLFGTLSWTACWASGSLITHRTSMPVLIAFTGLWSPPFYAVIPALVAYWSGLLKSGKQALISGLICVVAGALGIYLFTKGLKFINGEEAQIPAVYLIVYVVLAGPVTMIAQAILGLRARRQA